MPGDRHVVIGTKKGTLQIFDLASSSMTEEVDAHQKEVWSIHLAPDKRGFVTSSGDKTVKFWQFELVNRTTEDHDSGRLTDLITMFLSTSSLLAALSSFLSFPNSYYSMIYRSVLSE